VTVRGRLSLASYSAALLGLPVLSVGADDRLMRLQHVPRPAPASPQPEFKRAPHPVEALQRSTGNRAVQRLRALQREATAEQK
jgi:hypothetical protein